MVITVEIYKQIRKMRLQGTSQRQIAASLQIPGIPSRSIGTVTVCPGSVKTTAGKPPS